MTDKHTDQLFEGIIKSAQAEAAAIIERAKRDVALIETTYRKKVDEAIDQEERATQLRLEQIKRLEESTVRNLERRHSVSYGQRMRQLALESVAAKMASLIGNPGYRGTLVGWIAEAAIGLDRSEALVNSSFREKVDEQMLREAEHLVKKATGRSVSLRLGNASLTSQGIEVTSLDGKVAYNNQVSTRLVRYERKLKELMEGQQCQKG